MAGFSHAATLTGVAAPYVAGITDLTIATGAGGAQLYATSRVGGGLSAYDITDSGAVTLLSQQVFSGAVAHMGTPHITVLSKGEGHFLMPSGLLSGYRSAHHLTEDGQIGARMTFSPNTAPPDDLLAVTEVTTAGGTYVVASHDGRTGLHSYTMQDDGAMSRLDGSGGHGADITALASITVKGATFVLGVAPAENEITSYSIEADGQIRKVASLGSLESGIGFDTPNVVATAVAGGTGYAILGASGSSSLTVMQIREDGQMIPVEHVVDGRHTRFQNLSALETFTVGDRVFVLAGGADDGISLLTLTPDGRLIHLETLADTQATALQNVTAIAAAEVGGRAQVFAASETETGITQFTFDPGSIGLTRIGGAVQIGGTDGADLLGAGPGTQGISAGAGDDILMASASARVDLRMQGGAGADIFVAAHNGQSLRIDDFEAGVDRLDLSMIPMLRCLQQLDITSTGQGAVLRFGDTVIDVRTHNGRSLAQDAFTQEATLGLTRYAPPAEPEDLSGTHVAERLVLGGAGGRVMAQGGDDTITSSWGDATIGAGEGNDWI